MGDSEKECLCTSNSIERYRSRLSGPILDRIDLFIQVPRIKAGELETKNKGRTSDELRKIVEEARVLQKRRFYETSIHQNAEMNNKDIDMYWKIQDEARQIAIVSVEKLHLSTRVFYRILRVARTIADIDREEEVKVSHILEALSYRGS